MSITSKRWTVRLVAVAAICGAAYSLFLFQQRAHALSFVPDEISVSRVIYSEEQSWGFGPGDNETGVFAYELTMEVTDQIQNKGIGYFARSVPATNDDDSWRGKYDSWQPTPLQLEGSDENTSKVMSYEVSNYLNRYGFGIDIDPEIRRQINDALSRPGSFVAHGRIGVLIIAPAIRRGFYVYNG